MNSLSFFASFRLTKLSGLCFVLFMTIQNASAFDLQINNLNTSKISSHLSYKNLINKLPTLFVFKERDVAYMVDAIKNEYLTFYSDKNENLKATYSSGNYLIIYTSNW